MATTAVEPKANLSAKNSAKSSTKINADYVRRYVELREHKRELESQARNLGKLVGVMEGEMMAHIDAECGKRSLRVVTVGGWELAQEEKRGTVAWAKEFVKACGEELADQLRKAAPLVKRLAVRATTTRTLKQQQEARETVAA